jgi:hypothetical protein
MSFRTARVEDAEIPSACSMRIVAKRSLGVARQESNTDTLPSRRELLIGFGATIAATALPRDTVPGHSPQLQERKKEKIT